MFTLFAIPTALLTYKSREFEVNIKFHVPLFQEKFWPESIRNYFKIQNEARDENVKIDYSMSSYSDTSLINGEKRF
jgi:hypothetical protein